MTAIELVLAGARIHTHTRTYIGTYTHTWRRITGCVCVCEWVDERTGVQVHGAGLRPGAVRPVIVSSDLPAVHHPPPNVQLTWSPSRGDVHSSHALSTWQRHGNTMLFFVLHFFSSRSAFVFHLILDPCAGNSLSLSLFVLIPFSFLRLHHLGVCLYNSRVLVRK